LTRLDASILRLMRYQAEVAGGSGGADSFELERDEPLTQGDTFEHDATVYEVVALLPALNPGYDGFVRLQRAE
jgi:hypothetical protein